MSELVKTNIKWLIVTTSEDRSIDFFKDADVVYYGSTLKQTLLYDVIYLRDPFNTGTYEMQQIKEMIDSLLVNYPTAYFIDDAKTFKDMLFEDKWLQYMLLAKYMPNTQLLKDAKQVTSVTLAKKRISARARDIIFSPTQLRGKEYKDYIVQDKLTITDEYRVYSIGKDILSYMTKKSSKTVDTKVKVVDFSPISRQIQDFIVQVMAVLPDYDLLGFDIAQTSEGLKLLEVNRSPQFKRYNELTKTNIALDLCTYVEHNIRQEK